MILFFFSLLQDVFFCACLTVFIIVSAALLAVEADFRERHGTEFSSWFSDRLVAAVVRGNLLIVNSK